MRVIIILAITGLVLTAASMGVGAAPPSNEPRTVDEWVSGCERDTAWCNTEIEIARSLFTNCRWRHGKHYEADTVDTARKKIVAWLRGTLPGQPLNYRDFIQKSLAAVYPQSCGMPPSSPGAMEIPAGSFNSSESVAVGEKACGGGQYGLSVLLNAPPCNSVRNMAAYEIGVAAAGRYKLFVEYAAREPRPVRIVVNGTPIAPQALAAATGCWEERCQQYREQAEVDLRAGSNLIRLERDSYFPHIRALRLVPVAAPVASPSAGQTTSPQGCAQPDAAMRARFGMWSDQLRKQQVLRTIDLPDPAAVIRDMKRACLDQALLRRMDTAIVNERAYCILFLEDKEFCKEVLDQDAYCRTPAGRRREECTKGR